LVFAICSASLLQRRKIRAKIIAPKIMAIRKIMKYQPIIPRPPPPFDFSFISANCIGACGFLPLASIGS